MHLINTLVQSSSCQGQIGTNSFPLAWTNTAMNQSAAAKIILLVRHSDCVTSLPSLPFLVCQVQTTSCSLPWTSLIIILTRYWTPNLQLACKLFFISPLLNLPSSTSVLPPITLHALEELSATPAKSSRCPPSNSFLNLVCYDNYRKNWQPVSCSGKLSPLPTLMADFLSLFLCNSSSVFTYVILPLIIIYE